MAGYVRMTRAFVLESMCGGLRPDRAGQGPAARTVLFKHALRAALTPLVTMVGLDFAGAARRRDHHRVGLQLSTVSGKLAHRGERRTTTSHADRHASSRGAIFIVANIIVDILYAVIDPRVAAAD